jgi:glutathione synthase/RimK-type ligase-like ATP-grasp enzyme
MINAWLLTSPWPKPYFYETWRFLDEMKKRNLNAYHVHPDMCTVVGDKVYIENKQIDPPDLVIMRHAVWNPDGLRKLGVLRKYGSLFVTDIEPHIEALDKVYAHEKYIKAKIPLPKTICIDISETNASEKIGDMIGFPCVIKWRFAAASEKVFLCLDEFELLSITGNLLKFTSNPQFTKRLSSDPRTPRSKHNMMVIAQEYLDLNYMITAHSIKNRNIQGTMQAIPPSFNGYQKFQANFANAEGRVQLPINASDEMQDLINRSLDALNVEWGRVDIFPTKDGLKLCEINPSANFPMTEACSLENLAGHMIDHAIEKYQSLKR